jgi:Domain of unknown function (DUF4129)
MTGKISRVRMREMAIFSGQASKSYDCPMRNGVSRRAVAVGAALLGLTAIVALASRARGPGGGSTGTVSTDWLLEYLLLLLFVLFAAAVVSGIYLVVTAHQGAKWAPPPRASLWRTLVTLALLLGVVFALISSLHRTNLNSRPQKQTLTPKSAKDQRPGGSPAHFDWAPVAVVGGLVVVGLGAAAWILIRRRVPKKPLGEGADALIAALGDSLDDLRDEPDARRAVIAAYARMERALAYEGLGRREAEAPREYLARALPAVGAGAGSVARLTALFEEAKFSPHEVDGGMKAEAIDALVALRDELRAAAVAEAAAA